MNARASALAAQHHERDMLSRLKELERTAVTVPTFEAALSMKSDNLRVRKAFTSLEERISAILDKKAGCEDVEKSKRISRNGMTKVRAEMSSEVSGSSSSLL